MVLTLRRASIVLGSGTVTCDATIAIEGHCAHGAATLLLVFATQHRDRKDCHDQWHHKSVEEAKMRKPHECCVGEANYKTNRCLISTSYWLMEVVDDIAIEGGDLPWLSTLQWAVAAQAKVAEGFASNCVGGTMQSRWRYHVNGDKGL